MIAVLSRFYFRRTRVILSTRKSLYVSTRRESRMEKKGNRTTNKSSFIRADMERVTVLGGVNVVARACSKDVSL